MSGKGSCNSLIVLNLLTNNLLRRRQDLDQTRKLLSLRSHAIALDAADGLAVVGSIELSRSEDVLDGQRGEVEEDDWEEHGKVEENHSVLELLLRLRILDLNLLLLVLPDNVHTPIRISKERVSPVLSLLLAGPVVHERRHISPPRPHDGLICLLFRVLQCDPLLLQPIDPVLNLPALNDGALHVPPLQIALVSLCKSLYTVLVSVQCSLLEVLQHPYSSSSPHAGPRSEYTRRPARKRRSEGFTARGKDN
mmetsp:Transcript_33007/g.104359  ORF Transcript_33007/g.104359 Transcript_33007/m.104359 type:complete len:251 (+) Transcript_33007:557-1309(+)